MGRFIEGVDRTQGVLLPERLDDYIDDENPVRVVDVFVGQLDLVALDFDGVQAANTGRPGYHPSVLLKLYIYGYLNRIQSSRRLEREARRNVELDLRNGERLFRVGSCRTIASQTARKLSLGLAVSNLADTGHSTCSK